MITIEDIFFGEGVTDGSFKESYQAIFHKDKEFSIGCLRSIDNGFMIPIREIFQLRCIDNEESRKSMKKYNGCSYIAEDKGYMLTMFDTIEDFINFYNEL